MYQGGELFSFCVAIVVTIGADARPVAIAVVMNQRTEQDRKIYDTAFNACAVEIVSLAAPDMPEDQRSDFADKVMGANDAGIRYRDWAFTQPSAI